MPGSIPARGTTWPVSETGHHETLRTSYSGFESWAGCLIRDEGEMAPRLVWDQETAGSIPATAASSTEVIRLDEEPASKAGAGKLSVVGSSPTASAS
jgi:hypothetical protein